MAEIISAGIVSLFVELHGNDAIEGEVTIDMKKTKAIFALVLAVCLVLGMAFCSFAQDPDNQEVTVTEEPAQEETVEPDEQETDQSQSKLDVLTDYFEQYFSGQMQKFNIPGLAYAFVNEGQIVARGYGFANIEQDITVDPTTTLFPMEDLAKVLTATALLQLVEAKGLDLDVDVNRYLSDFSVSNQYPRPLTLRSIATHTTGFAESRLGVYASSLDQLHPLKEYLADNAPLQIYPPGKTSTYGDYGYGIAGLVIEEVSNTEFADYMQQHLLTPLAMNNTSFGLTDEILANTARGYVEIQGELEAKQPGYARNFPANSLISTVRDMANYMAMHLNNGIFNNRWVLGSDSVAMMQNQQFTQHPKLPGWTFGFYEHKAFQEAVIMHGGDSELGYSNIMFMLPDADFAMIVSINRYLPEFGLNLINDFMAWRYPADSAETAIIVDSGVDRTHWFVGKYTLDYPAWDSLDCIRRLFTQIYVGADESGIIHIDFPEELGLPTQWVEVEPLLLRAVDSEKYVAFIDNDYGEITHLYAGGIYNYSKVPWHKTTEVTLIAFTGFSVFFAAKLIVSLIRRIRNRRLRIRTLDRFHQNMETLICLVNLVFLGGLAYYVLRCSIDLLFGISPVLLGLLLLPWVSIVLTVILLIVGSSINKRRWPFSLRFYHFIIQAVMVVFLMYLWTWNLVGV